MQGRRSDHRADELALAEPLPCVGDALGDFLGARPRLRHLGRAPSLHQQRKNESPFWPNQSALGSRCDRPRRGQQFLFLRRRRGWAKRDSTRRRGDTGGAFMFASTNLVIELGVVLWILMGWRFVLAEIAGAFVLIALMWWLVATFLPRKQEEEIKGRAARDADANGCCHDKHEHELAPASPSNGGQTGGWRKVARAFVMDWSMLWKEISRCTRPAYLVESALPRNRLANSPSHRERAGRSYYCRALFRLFGGKYSIGEFALVEWHQFRRRYLFHLCRSHCYSAHHYLREILRRAGGGMDHGNLLRCDGPRWHHGRSHL
jgi:hypothetical protein